MSSGQLEYKYQRHAECYTVHNAAVFHLAAKSIHILRLVIPTQTEILNALLRHGRENAGHNVLVTCVGFPRTRRCAAYDLFCYGLIASFDKLRAYVTDGSSNVPGIDKPAAHSNILVYLLEQDRRASIVLLYRPEVPLPRKSAGGV
jgi:hypothetical protein